MDMLGLLLAGAALATLAGLGWILIHSHAQHARLSSRLDLLANRLGDRPDDDAVRADPLDGLAGKRAPEFALSALGGGSLTLADLLAPAKPLLLVVTDPRCGPCYELLPDIAGWQRVHGSQLAIALVSSGDPANNRAMTAEYGISPVLIQQELELVKSYELAQAPAAVVIQPDGRIAAGPRYGAHAIRQLVADTLGLVLPPPLAQNTRVFAVGEAVPLLRRPDLDGNPVDLAGARSVPTMLLFWSPGCEHCRALLPEALAFERRPHRPRMVVVSRSPVGLNRELGFRSPIVLDDDRAIAGLVGVAGTPAAVLIDEAGKIASPVARGGASVRALLAHLALVAPAAAD